MYSNYDEQHSKKFQCW